MSSSYTHAQAMQDLEQHYQVNHHNGNDPIIRKQRTQPGTIFYPGHRIRMNMVPMLLCFLIPWADSCLLMMITGYKLMHDNPSLAWFLVFLFLCFWLFFVYTAFRQRRHNPDPTWYTFLALVVGIASFAGIYRGTRIYECCTGPYYEVKSMNVQVGVDLSGGGGDIGVGGFGGWHGPHGPGTGGLGGAGGFGWGGSGTNSSGSAGSSYYRAPAAGQTKTNLGESLMDVGVAQFAPGSQVGTHLSWRFKWKDLYCVAPLLPPGGGMPAGQSYDVWLVGKNCCAEGSNDYRCGDWTSQGSSVPITGIRATNSDDLVYFHLAVQQAESMYRYQARHPLFFYSSRERLGGSAYESYDQGSGGYQTSSGGSSGSSGSSPGSSGSGGNSSAAGGSASSSTGGTTGSSTGASGGAGGTSASTPSGTGGGGGSGGYGDGSEVASDAGLANADRALEELKTQANNDFKFWAVWYLILFLFLMIIASAFFSFLGRPSPPYPRSSNDYNDASWASGGPENSLPSYNGWW